MYNITISFLNKTSVTCYKISKITYQSIAWNREVTDMVIEGKSIEALTVDTFAKEYNLQNIIFHGESSNYSPNLEYITLIEIESN